MQEYCARRGVLHLSLFVRAGEMKNTESCYPDTAPKIVDQVID